MDDDDDDDKVDKKALGVRCKMYVYLFVYGMLLVE